MTGSERLPSRCLNLVDQDQRVSPKAQFRSTALLEFILINDFETITCRDFRVGSKFHSILCDFLILVVFTHRHRTRDQPEMRQNS